MELMNGKFASGTGGVLKVGDHTFDKMLFSVVSAYYSLSGVEEEPEQGTSHEPITLVDR